MCSSFRAMSAPISVVTPEINGQEHQVKSDLGEMNTYLQSCKKIPVDI